MFLLTAKNPYIRDIDDVHQEISEEAASIANAAAKARGLLPFGVYGVFDPAHRKLGLVINEFIEDPDTLDKLGEVALESLQQALIERPDLTVGLILGDGRNGRNYFARGQ